MIEGEPLARFQDDFNAPAAIEDGAALRLNVLVTLCELARQKLLPCWGVAVRVHAPKKAPTVVCGECLQLL